MDEIFITDVKYRMAVPAIRVLHRKGHHITAIEYDNTAPAKALGFFSKCADAKVTVPYEVEGLIAELSRLASACKQKPVVIPIGRRTLGILSEHEEVREFADYLAPTKQALKLADNKREVLALAKEIGVPTPASATIEDTKNLEELAKAMIYPCVIKYQNGEALGLKPAQRYKIVKTEADFLEAYSDMEKNQSAPIAQEYVEGTGFGVSMIIDKSGALIDFICHRRVREYPTSGGPSSCCEAFFDRNMLIHAFKLLKAISFTGVAMVEFKGSVQNPKLMEINPRFWGTSPLVAVAGSTFYESLVCAAKGTATPLDPLTCAPNYKVGQVMRFFPQDLLAFPSYFKHSGNKLKFLGKYIADAFRPSVRDGLFDRHDKKPYFKYISNLARR